ncbi:MAG: pyridoxal 5'-phosphate synthase glutaminase subunit PdxT [Candidatus Micrarchaeota archaeon]|nr:pyridoxal 5'-phosphate synthase glutaminase subunit PdxT [Candidatus Micrarchaeota archaeon]
MKKIGVLALQGGVDEHIAALLSASEKISTPIQIVEVRNPSDMDGLDGIIIPGGESTTISKLMERAGIFSKVGQVRKIMGTCAGAVLLAKKVQGSSLEQRFLSVMDIEIERNAYGRQLDSFEANLTTVFGTLPGVFIRAPKMHVSGKGVQPMAFYGNDIVAAYQKKLDKHYLAMTFHPELTTTRFHEFFIKL